MSFSSKLGDGLVLTCAVSGTVVVGGGAGIVVIGAFSIKAGIWGLIKK